MYTAKKAVDIKQPFQQGEHGPPKEFVPIIAPEKKDAKTPRRPSILGGPSKKKRNVPAELVLLPSVNVTDEVADRYLSYVETDSFTRNNIVSMLRRRKAEMSIPGWLVQLSDARMNAMMDIQNAFKSVTEREALLATIHTIINKQMSFPNISKKEISTIIEGVAESKRSPISFSRFIFSIANPKFAKKCGILVPMTRAECNSGFYSTGDAPAAQAEAEHDHGHDQGGCGSYGSTSGKSGSTTKSKKSKPSSSQSQCALTTVFSEREQVFYSGLLVIQMSDTLQNVEQMYFQNYIPEPPQKSAKTKASKGFGMESIGVKKFGQSEWDKVPPVPKGSPYLSSIPFVTTRWKITKPNQDEKGRRRTLNQLFPLHLTVKPPTLVPEGGRFNFHGSVRITENRYRIKQVLEYLASKGDCVALLPGIHCMIHLSDTFIDKVEQVSMKPTKLPRIPIKPISVGNEISLIQRNALELYSLHGMPKSIAKIKSSLKFTDGLKLRKITDEIRQHHWDYIKGMAKLFGYNCWERMHIGLMKDGVAKNSFINTFLTYLPYAPQLPATSLGNVGNANPL